LQAVSGTGKPGVEELERQLLETASGAPVTTSTYPRQIAHNVLPLCESFRDDAWSTEEMKLLQETRKVLGMPALPVSMTCVRVPVRVGHSASMLVETERPLSVADARAALAAFPGVVVVDDPSRNVFPTPREVQGRDEVWVGRIRKDLASDRLWLWQVSDNLRKGAATNAVQIAETMIERGLA
jgi:aspartate-semialdehyde dehydrogenase